MSDHIGVRDRRIAHFTHLDNLASIVTTGALACDHRAHDGRLVTEVGDLAIKANRRLRRIPVGARGTVGEYVPFYFAPRSPMMYRIACDCRDSVPGRYQGGDRDLVYLSASVGSVVDAGLAWVASDGNAASEISRFSTDLSETDQMIDWPLMAAERWSNTSDDQDRQRRRMAELLVHQAVPLVVLHEVGAYSEPHADQARAALSGHPLAERVVVRTSWYYGYERR